MRLNINDSDQLDSPTDAEIRICIKELGPDQFLVLTLQEGCFVQTYHNADGSFELEYRQGEANRHYHLDSTRITIADVVRAFSLFLTQSEELAIAWDWQLLSFGPDVQLVDESTQPDRDSIVEYNGVLMSADWPQEIEDAQELRGYRMHGEPFDRVLHSVSDPIGKQDELCQECGVKIGQFHVPGCQQEDCPRCAGKLVQCSCEIDID